MKQIVCLSDTRWSSQPTRTQQLLTRLPGVDILFFEPPGPKTDTRGRKVRPNVMVYRLPKLMDLGSQTAVVARHNRRKIASWIERVMDRHRFREPLLWCTTPKNFNQLDYMAYCGLVYDCHRYWSDLPIAWEGELAASADVCFAASEGLVDRLAPCSQNIALLPNGANYELFSREALDHPADLGGLDKRPVIGFAGTLCADLDTAPILLAAQRHPEWTFLMVGPSEGSDYLAQLKEKENIRLVGKRSQVDLPNYLGRCSVCVNLLQACEEDSDVIPSRVYEYLSVGKPVVTMLWRHQPEEFTDVIYPARTPEEFVERCEIALRENPARLRRRRKDYGIAAAWENRVTDMMRILEANGLY